MNRIEYMTKLASLLQDIPEVERRDAMKYYNDYFDEAGEENEEQVIREFGAPEEVAENIKADLKGKTENTTHGQQEEYQSAGQQYQMNHQENKQSSEYQYGTSDDQKRKMPVLENCFNCGSCDNYRTGLDSNYRRYSGCRTGNGVNYHCWSICIGYCRGCHCNCRNFAGNIRFRYTSATDSRRIGIDWQRSDHNGSWCGCNSRIWKTL